MCKQLYKRIVYQMAWNKKIISVLSGYPVTGKFSGSDIYFSSREKFFIALLFFSNNCAFLCNNCVLLCNNCFKCRYKL